MNWVELITNWGPLLLILGLFIFFSMRIMHYYKNYQDHVDKVNTLAEETRQLNIEILEHGRQSLTVLEEIRDALKAGR